MDFIRESIPIEEGIKHTKIIQRRLKNYYMYKTGIYKTELACMSNVSSSTTHKPVADYDSESASTHKPDYESASIKTVYHIKKDVDKPDYKNWMHSQRQIDFENNNNINFKFKSKTFYIKIHISS